MNAIAWRREFLGWDRLFIDEVAARLNADKQATEETVIWVPTSRSAESLQSKLFSYSKDIYNIKMISQWVQWDPSIPLAEPWQERLAWMRVLESIEDWQSYEDLFSTPPITTQSNWAWSLALDMQHLRLRLCENKHAIASASGIFKPTLEHGRWECLVRLEEQVEILLHEQKLISSTKLIADAPKALLLPEGKRWIFAGILEFHPWMLHSIQQLAASAHIQVETWLPCPIEHQEDFDAFGQPKLSWSKRDINLPNETSEELITSNAQATSSKIIEHFNNKNEVLAKSSIIALDANTSSWIQYAMEQANFKVWNSTAPLVKHALEHWLVAWQKWMKQAGWKELKALLFSPLTQKVTGHAHQECYELFCELSTRWIHLSVNDMVERLGTLKTHQNYAESLKQAIESLLSWRQRCELNVSELQLLLAHWPEDVASTWLDWLKHANQSMLCQQKETSFWIDVLLHAAPLAAAPESHPSAIPILDWLELLFCPSPHLIVTDLNQGKLPLGIEPSAFIPASASKRLGLITHEQRAGRDAFLLIATQHMRKAEGSHVWFCHQFDSKGDPILPSQLLFQCKKQDLPERVQQLMKDADSGQSRIPWQRDWKWKLSLETTTKMPNVTDFRHYLECPFRFYLRKIARMQSSLLQRNEWNDAEFGNIIHQVLQSCGEAGHLFLSDADEIKHHLWESLDQALNIQAVGTWSAPMKIQHKAMRQRLAWFASEQALLVADGWKPVEFEIDASIQIDKYSLKARIDRIDQHQKTGAWLVIDYKTGTAKEVIKNHVTPLQTSSSYKKIPPHLTSLDCPARFTIEQQEYYWKDLQLPLYAAYCYQQKKQLPEMAYFNISSKQHEVTLKRWEDFELKWMQSAINCAAWVIQQIQAENFEPLNPHLTNSDWESLAVGGALDDAFEILK